MLRLAYLIRRIVGRYKGKMIDYFLSWGNIYIPIGVVLILFSVEGEKTSWDIAWAIMGIMFLIVGGLFMRIAYKRAKDDDTEKRTMFHTLVNEIQGLKKTLGGKEDNGGSNTNS